MPEPAVELTLQCYGSVRQRSETANDIVEECGFYLVGDSVMQIEDYILYQYEPFEEREENIEILEECVQQLSEEFPEMEVWSQHKSNRDLGNPVSRDYLIYIAPSREIVE